MNKGALGIRRQASRVKRWALVVMVLVFLPATAWGTPTTSVQVQQVIQNWRKLDPRPLGAALGAKIKGIQTFADGQGMPLYYVVSLEPASFVIVSGDDLVEPIVAFSPRGQYDPSPATTLGALVGRDLSGRVAYARELEARAPRLETQEFLPPGLQNAQRKWRALETPATSESLVLKEYDVSDMWVAPLLETTWGQAGAGGDTGPRCYNYYIPTAANPLGGYPCGCVATAMAQLMRYHQHPTAGVGPQQFTITIKGTPTQEFLLGGDSSGGPYNWNLMEPNPSTSTPENQRAAIGALTHDAGVAVGMNYALGASGISNYQSDRIEKAFRETFQYSNINWGYFNNYNIPAVNLHAMINASLDARLPVLLNVYQPSTYENPAHSLVADGYGFQSGTLYHHLNLGAEGDQDAWYNLPTIDSSPQKYSVVFDCFYNILPYGAGEIISGRVIDSLGLPLYRALVEAAIPGSVKYATTDEHGIFAFWNNYANTTYTLKVKNTGYQDSAPVAVTTGMSQQKSVTVGNVWGVFFALDIGIGLNEALDNHDLTFITGGNAAWIGDPTTKFYGGSSARSGAIHHGQSSLLSTTVQGPGTVSFYWTVSSESNDYLQFHVDDRLHSQISGSGGGWKQVSVFVPFGYHTLKWVYAKDSDLSSGPDAGWVDKLAFTQDTRQVTLPPLLAYFPLDGNADDASGNGHHGSVNGADPVQGLEGGAFSFDGEIDYIHVPLNINPSVYPKVTMGAWVKVASRGGVISAPDAEAPPPWQTILSCDDGGFDRTLCLDDRAGGYGWTAFCGTGGVLGFIPPSWEKWSFAAVVYDPPNVYLYMDGQMMSKQGITGDGFKLVRIAQNPGFGVFFKGVIDNVFFFGEALSKAQVEYIRDYGAAALKSAPDPAPPSGTVTINGGQKYTTSQQATLTLAATDNVGVTEMCLKNEGDLYWSAWEPYQAGKSHVLTPNDGPKQVWAKFRDAAGNESLPASATIYFDGNAPNGSLLINNGDPFTRAPGVVLTFSFVDAASGMAAMRFTNDPSRWPRFERYLGGSQQWEFPSGDGLKRVYAQFGDRAGNIREVSASITLDATAPTGTIAVNGGAAYTRTAAVTLNLWATDTGGSGLDKMQFSHDNATWTALETCAATKAWTLAAGDGAKTVYARFTDKAGNVSAAVSDSIILDTAAPTGTIGISGGAYTRIAAVTLNLTSAGGATQMCFSADKSAWTAWENVAATKLYNLTAPDGLKWVYVKYRDAAGNESAAAGASVTLDTTPPKDGTLKATAGNSQVILTWSGFSDATSGLSAYRLYYGTAGVPTAATGAKIYEGAALTFTQKNLTNGKTCYYRLVAVDKAGNVSAGATAAATPRAGGALPFLDLLLDN